jgi:protein-S-isoprenylcysteine O-methyltransferase Ste14
VKAAAGAIAVFVVVVALFFFVPVLRDQPWTPPRIAGAILGVIGFALVLTARIQLGESFAVMPQAKGLVTHGFYSRIRNPMYVFVDITVCGLVLALNLPWLLVLIPIWALLQARQAGREAKVLQEKFGQAYLDYRKKTWF